MHTYVAPIDALDAALAAGVRKHESAPFRAALSRLEQTIVEGPFGLVVKLEGEDNDVDTVKTEVRKVTPAPKPSANGMASDGREEMTVDGVDFVVEPLVKKTRKISGKNGVTIVTAADDKPKTGAEAREKRLAAKGKKTATVARVAATDDEKAAKVAAWKAENALVKDYTCLTCGTTVHESKNKIYGMGWRGAKIDGVKGYCCPEHVVAKRA